MDDEVKDLTHKEAICHLKKFLKVLEVEVFEHKAMNLTTLDYQVDRVHLIEGHVDDFESNSPELKRLLTCLFFIKVHENTKQNEYVLLTVIRRLIVRWERDRTEITCGIEVV